MASKTSTKTSSKRPRRRPNQAAQHKPQSTKKLVVSLIISLVLIFGLLRLGPFGITVYNALRLLFGSLAYLVVVCILFHLFGKRWLAKNEGLSAGIWTVVSGLLLGWHSYLFGQVAFQDKPIVMTSFDLVIRDLLALKVSQFAGGGLLGALFYKPVAFLVTNLGAYFIALLLIVLGLFLMSPWDIDDVMAFFGNSWALYRERAEQRQQARFLRQEEKRLAEEAAEAEALAELTMNQAEVADLLLEDVYSDPISEDIIEREVDIFLPNHEEREEVYDLDFDFDASNRRESDVTELEELATEPFVSTSDLKQQLLYKLPSIDLFAPDKPKNQSKEKKIVRENIKILEQTFASFGIKVTVERAEIGPSVTKYEIKPAVGVRVNRISNLADDLALALAAKDVRIEAPIPGKSLIGIEVPNSEIATVSFRELWEQSQTDPAKLLEVPLGKAVNGSSRSFDLARMPHILVAGSTGSGKSVAVNGIISSILMKARPDEVKFMMIDPKMVELSVYNDIPHLLIPVVTNPRKASKALQKVVDEMENRYELFSKVGVRNIAGYNAKVESWNATSPEKQVPLPLLVVIVDELADLMMVASKEVEDAIIRLGQKARAAGIHMILATQRPSVDVISGLIKANVPSRIAFAVSSGTDSRTILDTNGAEKLLGRGDMLFKPIDENHPVRLQGSFISDDDVERIVNFIKAQADADYDDSFDPGEVSEDDSSGNGGATQGDPLFEEAKALIIETQKASASMLQRRLSIGFNRATDLLSELEEAGVIGPAEGTKPRKVLMTP